MLKIYQRRNPSYNKIAGVRRAIVSENGRVLGHEDAPEFTFKCKDMGFTSTTTIMNGHIEKIKQGALETIDLDEDDIRINDAIDFERSTYIVKSVKFVDDEKASQLQNKAHGTMTIEVRGQ